MTALQDGSESNKPTDYPEIRISGYSKNKEDAASFVNEVLTLFVPEDILQSITITEQDVSEDSFVTHVTIDYSGT